MWAAQYVRDSFRKSCELKQCPLRWARCPVRQLMAAGASPQTLAPPVPEGPPPAPAHSEETLARNTSALATSGVVFSIRRGLNGAVVLSPFGSETGSFPRG